MEHYITAPFGTEITTDLHCGDMVYISGIIYTARDAAHKRMKETLDSHKDLPFDIHNNLIYYMGPSPARPGRPIGSAGPTTASRMDFYAQKTYCVYGSCHTANFYVVTNLERLFGNNKESTDNVANACLGCKTYCKSCNTGSSPYCFKVNSKETKDIHSHQYVKNIAYCLAKHLGIVRLHFDRNTFFEYIL